MIWTISSAKIRTLLPCILPSSTTRTAVTWRIGGRLPVGLIPLLLVCLFPVAKRTASQTVALLLQLLRLHTLQFITNLLTGEPAKLCTPPGVHLETYKCLVLAAIRSVSFQRLRLVSRSCLVPYFNLYLLILFEILEQISYWGFFRLVLAAFYHPRNLAGYSGRWRSLWTPSSSSQQQLREQRLPKPSWKGSFFIITALIWESKCLSCYCRLT